MSEIDINDYITQEVEVKSLSVEVTCHIDMQGLSEAVSDELDEQLIHEVATRNGYVKERTCRPVEPFDGETKHIIARGLERIAWPYKGCPECRCDFPQGSKYCPGCGAKVVEP